VDIICSVGSKLTINWYTEVAWMSGVLESLEANMNLKELHLNFYSGNALLDHQPSTHTAWFLFPKADRKSEPCLGEGKSSIRIQSGILPGQVLGIAGFPGNLSAERAGESYLQFPPPHGIGSSQLS
jgi:hypothetical protein